MRLQISRIGYRYFDNTVFSVVKPLHYGGFVSKGKIGFYVVWLSQLLGQPSHSLEPFPYG
ncbi:MAG: hypothetical protein KF760_32735 [Candidatus Eremiobacteraeota bacterium]|nr:hypothetical protein [Candidatus Eremiobacteraeota bacterium]